VNETKAEAFSAAVAALRRGDVIAFPTETLYGLGADALNAAAVNKVFQLKGRDFANPIPVLVADRDMLGTLVAEVPPLAERLIANFWPGPLTLVLSARKGVAEPLLNSSGGVGVRISDQSIATELAKALGYPITATSANPSSMAASSIRKPAPPSPKSSAIRSESFAKARLAEPSSNKLWGKARSYDEQIPVSSPRARRCMASILRLRVKIGYRNQRQGSG
jgi:tRNA threonylcarbamoyl adenosine modification protein (Sua5/YciO/YrdC/YwlC family)